MYAKLSQLGACSIDPNHPAVKRIITQLPADHTDEGIGAMLKEIKTLVDLEFAKWMDMPDTAKPTPCRMLGKVKNFADGKFDKVKMRCVVRGFFQRNGVDFGATYSPSCMLQTMRILLTLAVAFGWTIRQLDVRNAYCHGIMDK